MQRWPSCTQEDARWPVRAGTRRAAEFVGLRFATVRGASATEQSDVAARGPLTSVSLVCLVAAGGVPLKRFPAFDGHFGPALQRAGALDVRAYTFLPITGIAHRTPGLAHSYPPSHRHNGAIVFGLADRDDLGALLATPDIKSVIEQQAESLTAVHAYSVERTISVIDEVSR